jgi:hypothetical protein
MTIHQLLRESSFGPQEIEQMTAAYEAALKLLRLTDRADPITDLIARKIIEIASDGERDPPHICARALKELGVPLPEWGVWAAAWWPDTALRNALFR